LGGKLEFNDLGSQKKTWGKMKGNPCAAAAPRGIDIKKKKNRKNHENQENHVTVAKMTTWKYMQRPTKGSATELGDGLVDERICD
jgi:hypothetical protein